MSKTHGWGGRLLSAGLIIATAAILLLAILSWFFYTSLGADLESAEGDRVLCSYYRVRWPGNGSLWFGGGEHYRRLSARPVCEFDPACSAWRRPEHLPVPKTMWEWLGFWWIADPPCDPCNKHGVPKLLWGFWVGVPAWLPALFTVAWPLHRWQRGVQSARRRSRP